MFYALGMELKEQRTEIQVLSPFVLALFAAAGTQFGKIRVKYPRPQFSCFKGNDARVVMLDIFVCDHSGVQMIVFSIYKCVQGSCYQLCNPVPSAAFLVCSRRK